MGSGGEVASVPRASASLYSRQASSHVVEGTEDDDILFMAPGSQEREFLGEDVEECSQKKDFHSTEPKTVSSVGQETEVF